MYLWNNIAKKDYIVIILAVVIKIIDGIAKHLGWAVPIFHHIVGNDTQVS